MSYTKSETVASATIGEHALYYAGAGWQVFPAPPGEKKSHKKAEYSDGRKWGATCDPDEIRRDFEQWPDANIIRTGAISGFWAVDIDTPEGHSKDGFASLVALEAEHGALPPTLQAESPSGSIHYLFKYPAGIKIRNSVSRIAPGVDVRGDGGLVIAPPSVKPGRGTYRWLNSLPIADAPQWLLDKVKTAERVANVTGPVPDAVDGVSHDGIRYNELCWWIERKIERWDSGTESLGNDEWISIGKRIKCSFPGQDGLNAFLAMSWADQADAITRRWWDPKDFKTEGENLQTLPALLKHDVGTWMFREHFGCPMAPRPAGRPVTPGDPLPEGLHWTADGRTERCEIESEEGFTQIALEDFLAYLPLNQFVYLPTRALWPATTINTTLAPVEIGTKEVKKRNSDEVEEVPVTIPASKWLNRNKGVACMTWAPGYPMIVHAKTIQRDGWVDNPGKTTFNEYREPTIKHVPGDPSLWVNHIRLLCSEHTQHVLYYFAHRVQRPAEKINHALVFGGSQGIGKDTAFEPLKAAVGPWNFKEASPVTMMSQFDPYKKCVMLRVNEARDLGYMTRHEFYERIKNLSAAPPDVLTVNEKYLGETSIPNVCGMVVTTNHQDAIALPADDRRCFVMWSTLTKEDFTEQYWTDLYAWFANGGNEIVAHYLATLDLSGFNAKAYPLRTEAWHQMVGFSAAPEDAELADAIDVLGNPDALTVAAVIAKADCPALRDYLRERRNSRSIPVRFNKCEYVPVRNKAAKDGLWVVSKKRQVVYARKALSEHDRIAAAMSLAAIPMPPMPY